MERLKKIGLVAFVFGALFSPPLIPGVRIFYVLTLFSLFMLLFFYRKEAKELIKKTSLGTWAAGFGILAAYTAFVGGLSYLGFDPLSPTVYGVSIARLLITGICLPVCLLFLFAASRRMGYKLDDVLQVILYAVAAQAVLALLTFIIPPVKDLFVWMLQAYTDNSAIHNPWTVKYRLFGFSSDLFDHFGYAMGLLSVLPILLARRTGKLLYLAYIPLLLIPLVLNARTGLLIAIIMLAPLVGYGYYWTTKKRDEKLKKLLVRFTTVILTFLIAFVTALWIVMPAKVLDGIRDVKSIGQVLLQEQPSVHSTGAHLFVDDFWRLPSNPLSVIFGEAHGVYGFAEYAHSDVGYINDIWMFGIAGALFIYGLIIYFTLRLWPLGRMYQILAVSLLVAFFLYQFKGIGLWSANIGIMAHVLIVSTILAFSRDKKVSEGNGNA